MDNDKSTSGQGAEGLLERESFVFYRSWWDSLRELAKSEYKEIQREVAMAIIEYGLSGKLAEPLRPIGASLFAQIKRQIDVNNKRYLNSLKGGAPRGNKNALRKDAGDGLSQKQSKTTIIQPKTTKTQPNVNVNEDVFIEDNLTSISSFKVEEEEKNARAEKNEQLGKPGQLKPEASALPSPVCGNGDSVFIELPLRGGKTYGVTEKEIVRYQGVYPKIDVRQCVRNIQGWFQANPDKLRTETMIQTYINNWLKKDNGEASSQMNRGLKTVQRGRIIPPDISGQYENDKGTEVTEF